MKEEENATQSLWPPPYTLKKHARVRHPQLKITPHKGLEVIVPLRFSQKHIPVLLETHKAWIEKKLQAWRIISVEAEILPTKIFLAAIEQQYHIEYVAVPEARVTLLKRPKNEIVLFGQIENKLLCKKLLMKWIRSEAKEHLIPWLAQLSKQTKLSYQEVNIRSQRSRWGSCSHNKTIHLNDRLLFLPSPLVTHILLHELCHTVHFNHSEAFWQLLASHDPLWETNKRELHTMKKDLPAWTY